MGGRESGGWGVTVENKRLHYVSTANAQPLSENVPTNVCLFVFKQP